MSDENDGILGNLPRSRPGVRSDKRASAKPTAGAAKPSAKATKPRAPRKAATPPPPPPPPTPEPERPADPLGMALKAGESVARTGIKVAGRMAGEVIRRLPRP